MRRGYAIRDRKQRMWLATRTKVEGMEHPVAVWVQSEADAMIFGKLPEARRMLSAVREGHRNPAAVQILDPRWREVD